MLASIPFYTRDFDLVSYKGLLSAARAGCVKLINIFLKQKQIQQFGEFLLYPFQLTGVMCLEVCVILGLQHKIITETRGVMFWWRRGSSTKANSREYPGPFYQRGLQARGWLLLKGCPSENNCLPGPIRPNSPPHKLGTGHLGPARTLLGAEVRTGEETSSHQLIRAPLRLCQMQTKEQLTHDEC